VDQNKVKITCVEAAPKMLPMFSEELVKHLIVVFHRLLQLQNLFRYKQRLV
jgi:NADH dehydrogenase FAD-containing subunit